LLILCLLVAFATSVFAQAPVSTPAAAPTPIPESSEIKQGATQDIILKEVEAKDAIKALGKSLKYNVVFDESVRIPAKLDLELKDVTVGTALKVIFLQHKLRAFLIDGNTVYIHSDNPETREIHQL
jgi:hypothetical protein